MYNLILAKCVQDSYARLTVGTSRPSAMVLESDIASTGLPALMASLKLGHISDSTACRDAYMSLILSLTGYFDYLLFYFQGT